MCYVLNTFRTLNISGMKFFTEYKNFKRFIWDVSWFGSCNSFVVTFIKWIFFYQFSYSNFENIKQFSTSQLSNPYLYSDLSKNKNFKFDVENNFFQIFVSTWSKLLIFLFIFPLKVPVILCVNFSVIVQLATQFNPIYSCFHGHHG